MRHTANTAAAITLAVFSLGPTGAAHADAASIEYAASCTSRFPAADEVLVFEHGDFGGACAKLKPGFYPRAGNLGINNDRISAVRVGANVRLRAFWDAGYRGGWSVYTGAVANLGNWNDEISSARVEIASRRLDCSDLQGNEFALYHHLNFNGDCVVLPGGRAYGNADEMGIANDSVSSVRTGNVRVRLKEDAALLGPELTVNPFSAKNLDHCPDASLNPFEPGVFCPGLFGDETSSVESR